MVAPSRPSSPISRQDLAVETLVEIGGGHARLQFVLRIAFGGVADEPLLVGQLVVEIERIGPVERKDGRLAHCEMPRCSMKSRALLAAARALRHPGLFRRDAGASAAAEALLERQPEARVPVALAEFVENLLGVGAVGEEQQALAIAGRIERIVDVERDRSRADWPIFDEGRAVRFRR